MLEKLSVMLSEGLDESFGRLIPFKQIRYSLVPLVNHWRIVALVWKPPGEPQEAVRTAYLHVRAISATFLKLEDQNTASAILIHDSPNKHTTTAMTSWLDSLPTSVDPDDKEMKRLILKNFLTADNMSTCYTSNVGRRLNMGEPIFNTCPKMFTFPRKKNITACGIHKIT